MKEALGITGLVILVITLIVVGPLTMIWSLNTLFSLNIAYSFWTWLSMSWLSLNTFGSVVMAINKLKK